MAASSSAKVLSTFKPGLFNSKVAIVTGGGTGIGKTITRELLNLGCKVMIASRNVERLQKAAKQMKEELDKDGTADISYQRCNIKEEDQVQSLISNTLKEFGKIDYLVNNGGGQFLSSIGDLSTKGWNAVIQTNLTGTFQMCREVYNQWMKDNGGSIVNITINTISGAPGGGHSGAARAGVDNLCKTLALEWARNGVRINNVAPGPIYSETAAANYKDLPFLTNTIPIIPCKRLGTTEEVSATVCFLLSRAASFMTGQTVTVDGGASLYGHLIFKAADHENSEPYTWGEYTAPTLADYYKNKNPK
ncbi:peroxisomal trans-2-enoyl-CoA reductase-like [Ptychodera flava]|uniref:peroxisomal trans-2-enoyl-CoA reductase-like n=1 Tax=Ptychodera flava TaxID=63121 RepID=UPI00396A3E9E